MKKIKTLFKSIRGKSVGKNDLSADDTASSSGPIGSKTLLGLKKVMRYLEMTEHLPANIYNEPGFIEEIPPIEALINGGKISESYLGTVRSVHSIAMGFVNVLRSHDPVIPYDTYDHALSPLADLRQLTQQIANRSPSYTPIMMHLTGLVDNGRCSDEITDSDLAAAVGVMMLRSLSDDMAGIDVDNDSYETQMRIKTFAMLMQFFRQTKNPESVANDCSTESQQDQQEATLTLPASAPSPAYAPQEQQQKLPPLALSPSVMAIPPSTPGATTLASSTAPVMGSIQERSVKVLFVAPSEYKPTKDELMAMVQQYGTINNIGFKEKLAVVLFSSPEEAVCCARDQEGRALGPHLKVKYLGGKLPLEGPGSASGSNTAEDRQKLEEPPQTVDSALEQRFDGRSTGKPSPMVASVRSFTPVNQCNTPTGPVLDDQFESAVPDTETEKGVKDQQQSKTGWISATKLANTSTVSIVSQQPAAAGAEVEESLNSSSGGFVTQVQSFDNLASASNLDHSSEVPGVPGIDIDSMGKSRADTSTADGVSSSIVRMVDLSALSAASGLGIAATHGTGLTPRDDVSICAERSSATILQDIDNRSLVSASPTAELARNTHNTSSLNRSQSADEHQQEDKKGPSPKKFYELSDSSDDEKGDDLDGAMDVAKRYPNAPRAKSKTLQAAESQRKSVILAAQQQGHRRSSAAGAMGSPLKSSVESGTEMSDSLRGSGSTVLQHLQVDVSVSGECPLKADEAGTGEDSFGSNAWKNAIPSKGMEPLHSPYSEQVKDAYVPATSTDANSVNSDNDSATRPSEVANVSPSKAKVLRRRYSAPDVSIPMLVRGGESEGRVDASFFDNSTAHGSTSRGSSSPNSSDDEADDDRGHKKSLTSPSSAVTPKEVEKRLGKRDTTPSETAPGGAVPRLRTAEVHNSKSLDEAGSPNLEVKRVSVRTIHVMSPRSGNSSEHSTPLPSPEKSDSGATKSQARTTGTGAAPRQSHTDPAKAKVTVLQHDAFESYAPVGEVRQKQTRGEYSRHSSQFHADSLPTQPVQHVNETTDTLTQAKRTYVQNIQNQKPRGPEEQLMVSMLHERVQTLEVQLRVHEQTMQERIVEEQQMERQWSDEILALRLKKERAETENNALREALRRAKIDLSNQAAALHAVEASRKSLQQSSKNWKDKAERDALATILAQKKLIESLEKQLHVVDAQSHALDEELSEMKIAHERSLDALTAWKARALSLMNEKNAVSKGEPPTHAQQIDANSRVGSPESEAKNDLTLARNIPPPPQFFNESNLGATQQPNEEEEKFKVVPETATSAYKLAAEQALQKYISTLPEEQRLKSYQIFKLLHSEDAEGGNYDDREMPNFESATALPTVALNDNIAHSGTRFSNVGATKVNPGNSNDSDAMRSSYAEQLLAKRGLIRNDGVPPSQLDRATAVQSTTPAVQSEWQGLLAHPRRPRYDVQGITRPSANKTISYLSPMQALKDTIPFAAELHHHEQIARRTHQRRSTARAPAILQNRMISDTYGRQVSYEATVLPSPELLRVGGSGFAGGGVRSPIDVGTRFAPHGLRAPPFPPGANSKAWTNYLYS